MTLWEISLLVLGVLALTASAFFSIAEVAIFSVRPHMIRGHLQKKSRTALWLDDMLTHPRRFLITILLGNVLCNAIVVSSITIYFIQSDTLLHQAGWILGLLGVLLALGEFIPKSIASQNVLPLALSAAVWLRPLEKAVHPLILWLDQISQQMVGLLDRFSIRPIQGLTEKEYLTMLDAGTNEGALLLSEKRLIEKTLSLASRNLRELMTPRGDMSCLDVEMDLEEMRRKAMQFRRQRLPLYSESLDNIVGVLNVKPFLLGKESDLMTCVEPPAFVPESMSALELLKNFLRGHQHMAMVVDEFGGVEGLITLEDVEAELFGDIPDEYDEELSAWSQLEPGAYRMHGFIHLSDAGALLKTSLEAEGIDTLGGWLTDRIGAIPRVGDACTHEGYVFQIEKMDRLRVGTVLAWKEKRKS